MHILVVAPDAPFPPVGGGRLRLYHFLRALAGHHDLSLVAFQWGAPTDSPPFPVRVVEVPWEMPPLHREMQYGDEPAAQAAFERLAVETDEPFFVSYYQSPAMTRALRQVGRDRFDLVVFDNSFMARYLPDVPEGVPRLLHFYDIHALIARRRAEGASGIELRRADADRTLRFERRAASRCDLHVAVSHAEAEAARALLGVEGVHVVPNGVDTAYFCPDEDRAEGVSLLFTGSMNYRPNIEAARYFAEEVLPLIRRSLPEATFRVVGTSPTEEVRGLASEARGVVVHGAVPDMRPYFRLALVVVVPIRQGGGTRLKILEAAASGKAIVSTSVGAEGLDLRPGRDLIIADSAPEFADAVVRLCRDERRRRALGQQARLAALPYDWGRIGHQFLRMIDEFGGRRPAPTPVEEWKRARDFPWFPTPSPSE